LRTGAWIVVEADAVAVGAPPPETVAWLDTDEGAEDETLTVTVIAG
jgi:hypothetical protein